MSCRVGSWGEMKARAGVRVGIRDLARDLVRGWDKVDDIADGLG